MIVPITGDDEWKAFLVDLPVLQTPAERAVIIAPHPDDESLGTGGLIATLRQSGIEVIVIAVTDGEGAYADTPDLCIRRTTEQAAALSVLNVDRQQTIRLGLPDRDVAAHESTLVNRIVPFVHEKTCLVAPWTGDFHPDHEACGRAARRVAEISGARLLYYFFWTWHRGTPESLTGLSLQSLPLDPAIVELKVSAVQCHQSQLQHHSGEPILPEDLLKPLRWPFEVFATE